MQSKYQEAISQYNTDYDYNEIKERVATLLDRHKEENNTKEVKMFLLNSVELTSLDVADNEDKILRMVERVNQFDSDYGELGHVASVCVYPVFANICHDSLENEDINITCVCGNFPSSQTFQEVKVAETAMAIHEGATEIDTVMPVGMFLAGDYEAVADELSELKEVCGNKPLKVILETGALKTLSNIKKAAVISMYAGADYIKTSTGKIAVGATPEAAYVMCEAIKEYYEKTGIQIGFKPAGGMKTVDDALSYYTIVKQILGDKWLNNKIFRLGTSSLANLLLNDITGKQEKYF